MSPRTQKRQETAKAAAVPRPRRPAREESKAPAEETAAAAEKAPEEHGGITIPVVHTRLRTPSVGLPAIGLPSLNSVPGRVLWLGGLGAFAALGAIDWPVAVAVAAGTWVAEQRAKERLREEQMAAEKG